MMSFEQAVVIAAKYHDGQKDMDGKPVLLHPLSVALKGENEDERIVGVLHDVIEDTSCTFQDLQLLGASDGVIETLKLLTHNKGTSYDDYITMIIRSGNKVAINVKMNDLMHNISRNDESTDRKRNIKAKHMKALHMILEAIGI